MIHYSHRVGVYVDSVELAKHLNINHADLMRRVERVKRGYINYDYKPNKFCKGGKQKYYMLRYSIISKLKGLDTVSKDMLVMQKEISEQIRIRLDKMFGR